MEACLQGKRLFYIFVCSIDGFLGIEDDANIESIASCLAENDGNPTISDADTPRVGSQS